MTPAAFISATDTIPHRSRRQAADEQHSDKNIRFEHEALRKEIARFRKFSGGCDCDEDPRFMAGARLRGDE